MPELPAVYRAEETLVEKPWGYEIRWAITEHYAGKILHVRKGEALSLQYHERKDEWLLVTRGTVDMELGVEDGQLKTHRMHEGDSVHHAADAAPHHCCRGRGHLRGFHARARGRRAPRRPLRPGRNVVLRSRLA